MRFLLFYETDKFNTVNCMKNIKLLHAIFLISGTAIGAGLVALPLVTVNLGIYLSIFIIALMVFVAYQSSMMTIDLNAKNKEAASIIKLSEDLFVPRIASLLSFCTLSFALLTVYVSAFSGTLSAFCNINDDFLIILCGIMLFAALSLNVSCFRTVNSALVLTLLVIVGFAVMRIHSDAGDVSLKYFESNVTTPELLAFLPIGFTSFGVQNICPHVYRDLNGDRKLISRAFIIGIIIPALVYVVFLSCVFENIITRDPMFFKRLQNHQVSVGELIKFLCNSSDNLFMELILKTLTLFAIATSAIGIGLGLLKSFQEMLSEKSNNRTIAAAIICLVPVLVGIIIPNAFINVLSFGGMIATVFVIFVPHYLLKVRNLNEHRFGNNICLAFGILIVLCELSRYIM